MKVLKSFIPNIVFANLFSVQHNTKQFLDDIYKKYSIELKNPSLYPEFMIDIPHTKLNPKVHTTIDVNIQNRNYNVEYELDTIKEHVNQEIEEEINKLTWEVK
jgi:hypothetical protein